MPEDHLETTEFDVHYKSFTRRVVIISAVLVFIGAILFSTLQVSFMTDNATRVSTAIIVVLSLVAFFLARKGKVRLASGILIIGSHLAVCESIILSQEIEPIGFYCFIFFIAAAAFLISHRSTIALLVFSLIIIFIGRIASVVEGSLSGDEIVDLVSGLMGLVLTSLVIYIFSRRLALNLEAHRRRLIHNEKLFRQVPDAAKRLSAASQEIYVMNEGQKKGMVHQSSAVMQTRNSLRSLLESSNYIVNASQQSQTNAATTLKNAEIVVGRITQLARHTERIVAILDTIRTLANKTDLLALNAALEGTKAGEAGRGFSLVASQMQRLAENTGSAVVDIRKLTEDIAAASTETRLSTDETTKIAKISAEEAQRISLTMKQQMESIEQVTGAMDDIAEISIQMSTGTEQTIASTSELTALAESLLQMVEEFKAAADSDT